MNKLAIIAIVLTFAVGGSASAIVLYDQIEFQTHGWVTVNGKETTTITNPEASVVLERIELQKSGAEFVFGSKPVA